MKQAESATKTAKSYMVRITAVHRNCQFSLWGRLCEYIDTAYLFDTHIIYMKECSC